MARPGSSVAAVRPEGGSERRGSPGLSQETNPEVQEDRQWGQRPGVLRIDAPRRWVYATVHEPKCWEQVRGAMDTGNLTRAPLFKENATAPSAARAQAPLARNLQEQPYRYWIIARAPLA